MTVQAQYEGKLRVSETLDLALDNVADPSVVHEIAEVKATLTAASTPPATKAWSDDRQLTAGADTIDLAALPGPFATTVDLTGLKVQALKIVCPATNTDRVVFAVGALNPYNIFGSATGLLSLGPGEAALLAFNDSLPDVAAGAKQIDVSSADVDALYEILVVAG